MSVGVRLSEILAAGVVGRLRGEDVTIRDVHRDSRSVRAGDLFVALTGEHTDGASFAEAAVAAGARAVLAERELPLDVPQIISTEPLRALPIAAALAHGRPFDHLRGIGITGTNGKTTCVHLLSQVLTEAGREVASVGTGYVRAPGIERASPFTTPYGDDLARFAAEAVEAGATDLLMEVSSHALSLHRVDAVRFEVAGFTNLSQDHLDFHPDIESYGRAKARLFLSLLEGVGVVNVDDPMGAELAEELGERALTVSAQGREDADVRATRHESRRAGLRAELEVKGRVEHLASPLLGEHNLENLLVVLGCAEALGLPTGKTLKTLSASRGAPGRLERIAHPGDVEVLVDYAHTPDALERVLAALRPVTPGRLFVVFGCGGDRDRGKRPLMGEVAARGADLALLTSDNPRTEDPVSILDQVVPGIVHSGAPALSIGALREAERGYAIEVDRSSAIGLAIGAARAGDTVLIAGKGHEDYQIIGDERLPFDDRIEARRFIERGEGG